MAVGPELATAVATGVPQRVQNAWASSKGEPHFAHDLILSPGCPATRTRYGHFGAAFLSGYATIVLLYPASTLFGAA